MARRDFGWAVRDLVPMGVTLVFTMRRAVHAAVIQPAEGMRGCSRDAGVIAVTPPARAVCGLHARLECTVPLARPRSSSA